MLRHWVQASWNHWRQLRHCNIFRFHLKGRQRLWPSDGPPHPVCSPLSWALPPRHPSHSLPPSSLTLQGLHSNSSSAVCCSDAQHPNPALSVHKAGRASCPAWPGHRVPSSGRLPSAEEQMDTSERQKRRRELPHKGQRAVFTLVAIAKTHWRHTQDVPSPSPGAGALGT